LLRVAQVEVDFDAAERRRNFVYDSRNEFFNVKSGRDALREFLHAPSSAILCADVSGIGWAEKPNP